MSHGELFKMRKVIQKVETTEENLNAWYMKHNEGQ